MNAILNIFIKLFAVIILFNLIEAPSNANIIKDEIISQERDELDKNHYLLGPGDYLSIIFDVDENNPETKTRTTVYQIFNDGSISIPYSDSIYIEDLTIEQAKNKIIKELSKELISPQIQVSLKRPRPIQVSIVGEVEKKGIYIFESNQAVGKNSYLPTVVSAIQKAGGIKKDANLSEVNLIRRYPTFDGKIEKKITSLNLKNLILEGDQSQNPFLFDGDIIKIKKAKDISNNRNNEVLSSLSSNTIRVTVVGEVANPGNLILPSNITLNQAIFAAGGPIDSRADRAKVNLFSFRDNGTLSKETFGIDLSKATPSKYNPNLSNGDVIKVNKNSLSGILDPLNTATDTVVDPFIKTFTLIKLINGD